MAKITFYGGAGSVTGANFLLDMGDKKFLVDCGTHERENICDPANHAPFAYSAKNIDTLFVTHAHQDHIGRVPKLVREGFDGTIYSTPATKDLTAVMFDDAINVMTHEANKLHCEPIYDKRDADKALSLWKTFNYHEPLKMGSITVEFLDAGHILGSAMIKFSRHDRSIIFTGDLGNSPEPLLHDTESPVGANYLVMESVYGDRLHEHRDERVDMLRDAIENTRTHHGTLLIPSFSVERTQIILFEIHKLMEEGKLSRIPIFLDAPLAERITEVFRKYRGELNADAQKEFMRGDIFSFPGLQVIHHYDDSIHKAPNSKVIIAGAGMSSGGRIRSHEKKYLPDPTASVLIAGYQAPGSLGRRIQDGERQVRIDGEMVPVHAKISTLTGYSGHKDRDGLLEFVEQAAKTPDGISPNNPQSGSLEKVYVVMGEPKASQFLAQRIKDFINVDAVVPLQKESVEIDL
jgi:metallo-beta-lactamase family protein